MAPGQLPSRITHRRPCPCDGDGGDVGVIRAQKTGYPPSSSLLGYRKALCMGRGFQPNLLIGQVLASLSKGWLGRSREIPPSPAECGRSAEIGLSWTPLKVKSTLSSLPHPYFPAPCCLLSDLGFLMPLRFLTRLQ